VKRRTKVLIVLGILLSIGGIVAWQWDSILGAYVFHSVRTVTTDLPYCDRLEVFHLRAARMETNLADRPADAFPVRLYGSYPTILSTDTFSGTEAESLASLWRAQTFGPGFQALCHSPTYGLRFFSGRKLLFEMTLCFHCANFHFTDLSGGGFWGFDTGSPKASELLRRLQEIFPASIPKPK
jgi:hypothetical protein